MQIFCLSDLHYDDKVNRSILDFLFEKMKKRKQKIDLIASLGDNPDTFLEYMLKELNEYELRIPIVGVLGSHDNINMFKRKDFFHIHNLNNNEFTLDGKLFIGIQGGNEYKENESFYPSFSQDESIAFMRSKPQNADFVISHNAPWGIHDKKTEVSMGFKGIMEYIQINYPKFVVHGNLQKNMISLYRKKTYVVSVHEMAVFDTEKLDIIPLHDPNSI